MTALTIDPTRIEAFQTWKSRRPASTSLWDYVSAEVSILASAALCSVLWPTFCEVGDCILLADNASRTDVEKWIREHHDHSKVEAIVNHVHLYDLFDAGSSDETLNEDRTLETLDMVGRVMQKMWKAALQDAFPQLRFAVEYSNHPDDYGPTITFYRVRSDPV